MQQFSDERSRACWRRPPRCALFLRQATPTRPGFSRAHATFVGVSLPAAPYSSASPRQHDPTFPGRAPPLLASPSPLRLIPSSRHANTALILPGGRHLCWRPSPRCALFLRLVTPTWADFSRADGAQVGVPLPATPYSSASPRQHGPTFPERAPPLLAPPSPRSLISSSRHANTVRLFPGGLCLCWRLPPREALFLRLATPTRPNFSRAGAAFVGVPLPATPYSFVTPRQHGLDSPGRTPPLLAPPSPLRLIPPPRQANTTRIFPGGRHLCWRLPPCYTLFLRFATPTRPDFSRAGAAFVGVPLPATPYSFVSPRQHGPGIFLTRPGNFLTRPEIS